MTKRKEEHLLRNLRNKLFNFMHLESLEVKLSKNTSWRHPPMINGFANIKLLDHLKKKTTEHLNKKSCLNFEKKTKDLQWKMIFAPKGIKVSTH